MKCRATGGNILGQLSYPRMLPPPMALSDTACRNAHKSDKSKDGKAFKLFDEKDLFLLVKPTASGWGKWWGLNTDSTERKKQFSLGTYPEINLGQAREKRDEARKLVAAMIDPGEHRKAVKEARADSVANSFERMGGQKRLRLGLKRITVPSACSNETFFHGLVVDQSRKSCLTGQTH